MANTAKLPAPEQSASNDTCMTLIRSQAHQLVPHSLQRKHLKPGLGREDLQKVLPCAEQGLG